MITRGRGGYDYEYGYYYAQYRPAGSRTADYEQAAPPVAPSRVMRQPTPTPDDATKVRSN